MLTVGDANEAKCERKPEMNHPGLSRAAVFFPRVRSLQRTPQLAASRFNGAQKPAVTLSLLCLKLLTVFNFTSYRAGALSVCESPHSGGDPRR